VDKYGEVIFTSRQVIRPNTQNCAHTFEFVLPPPIFSGAPKFLNVAYKAPPILHHLAKFHGDRPRGLGDFASQPIARENYFGEAPNFGTFIA